MTFYWKTGKIISTIKNLQNLTEIKTTDKT
jgi:hypothetical protein